jgi:hypothetical protein
LFLSRIHNTHFLKGILPPQKLFYYSFFMMFYKMERKRLAWPCAVPQAGGWGLATEAGVAWGRAPPRKQARLGLSTEAGVACGCVGKPPP